MKKESRYMNLSFTLDALWLNASGFGNIGVSYQARVAVCSNRRLRRKYIAPTNEINENTGKYILGRHYFQIQHLINPNVFLLLKGATRGRMVVCLGCNVI